MKAGTTDLARPDRGGFQTTLPRTKGLLFARQLGGAQHGSCRTLKNLGLVTRSSLPSALLARPWILLKLSIRCNRVVIRGSILFSKAVKRLGGSRWGFTINPSPYVPPLGSANLLYPFSFRVGLPEPQDNRKSDWTGAAFTPSSSTMALWWTGPIYL